MRPRPNRRHFADDIFKCISENENEWISPRISLKFVPKVRINNIPALVQIMAWRRPGDKPLSEPMMVRLPTHICVTRPKWVKLCDKFTYLTPNFSDGLADDVRAWTSNYMPTNIMNVHKYPCRNHKVEHYYDGYRGILSSNCVNLVVETWQINLFIQSNMCIMAGCLTYTVSA